MLKSNYFKYNSRGLIHGGAYYQNFTVLVTKIGSKRIYKGLLVEAGAAELVEIVLIS